MARPPKPSAFGPKSPQPQQKNPKSPRTSQIPEAVSRRMARRISLSMGVRTLLGIEQISLNISRLKASLKSEGPGKN